MGKSIRKSVRKNIRKYSRGRIANKRTNKRINKRTNKRTNKLTNKRTNKRTNKGSAIKRKTNRSNKRKMLRKTPRKTLRKNKIKNMRGGIVPTLGLMGWTGRYGDPYGTLFHKFTNILHTTLAPREGGYEQTIASELLKYFPVPKPAGSGPKKEPIKMTLEPTEMREKLSRMNLQQLRETADLAGVSDADLAQVGHANAVIELIVQKEDQEKDVLDNIIPHSKARLTNSVLQGGGARIQLWNCLTPKSDPEYSNYVEFGGREGGFPDGMYAGIFIEPTSKRKYLMLYALEDEGTMRRVYTMIPVENIVHPELCIKANLKGENNQMYNEILKMGYTLLDGENTDLFNKVLEQTGSTQKSRRGKLSNEKDPFGSNEIKEEKDSCYLIFLSVMSDQLGNTDDPDERRSRPHFTTRYHRVVRDLPIDDVNLSILRLGFNNSENGNPLTGKCDLFYTELMKAISESTPEEAAAEAAEAEAERQGILATEAEKERRAAAGAAVDRKRLGEAEKARAAAEKAREAAVKEAGALKAADAARLAAEKAAKAEAAKYVLVTTNFPNGKADDSVNKVIDADITATTAMGTGTGEFYEFYIPATDISEIVSSFEDEKVELEALVAEAENLAIPGDEEVMRVVEEVREDVEGSIAEAKMDCYNSLKRVISTRIRGEIIKLMFALEEKVYGGLKDMENELEGVLRDSLNTEDVNALMNGTDTWQKKRRSRGAPEAPPPRTPQELKDRRDGLGAPSPRTPQELKIALEWLDSLGLSESSRLAAGQLSELRQLIADRPKPKKFTDTESAADKFNSKLRKQWAENFMNLSYRPLQAKERYEELPGLSLDLLAFNCGFAASYAMIKQDFPEKVVAIYPKIIDELIRGYRVYSKTNGKGDKTDKDIKLLRYQHTYRRLKDIGPEVWGELLSLSPAFLPRITDFEILAVDHGVESHTINALDIYLEETDDRELSKPDIKMYERGIIIRPYPEITYCRLLSMEYFKSQVVTEPELLAVVFKREQGAVNKTIYSVGGLSAMLNKQRDDVAGNKRYYLKDFDLRDARDFEYVHLHETRDIEFPTSSDSKVLFPTDDMLYGFQPIPAFTKPVITILTYEVGDDDDDADTGDEILWESEGDSDDSDDGEDYENPNSV